MAGGPEQPDTKPGPLTWAGPQWLPDTPSTGSDCDGQAQALASPGLHTCSGSSSLSVQPHWERRELVLLTGLETANGNAGGPSAPCFLRDETIPWQTADCEGGEANGT